MAGARIDAVNEGLRAYRDDLVADTLAAMRVEVAVVTFGGRVETVRDFTTAETFDPPTLTVSGDTPMGTAIIHGVEMVKKRKQFYNQQGLHYFRPWIFLFTDGGPTDNWRPAIDVIRQGEESKEFAFFAVAVGDEANMDVLRQLASARRPPIRLKERRFRDMFVWLSESQRSVSRSNPGQEDQVKFVNPTGPEGWGSL
jgi:uncharacterized protein YegL